MQENEVDGSIEGRTGGNDEHGESVVSQRFPTIHDRPPSPVLTSTVAPAAIGSAVAVVGAGVGRGPIRCPAAVAMWR